MNSAHLHLILTHAPVFGVIAGILLLTLGCLRKNEEIKRLSLWVFVGAGLLVIPTYLTGAPAEDQMKRLMPTNPMDIADQHAEVAILALVAVLFAAVLSLAGVFMFTKDKGLPRWFSGLVVCIGVISIATLSWTANLGGKVRHTEIRPQVPASAPSGH